MSGSGAFEDLLTRGGAFLGAAGAPAASGALAPAARGVLFGAPMDFTVSFRPGARLGPSRIREVSQVLEEYSFTLDDDLARHPFVDAGDVALPLGNVAASLDLIEAVVSRIAAGGRIPFMIGGEHLVTWPALKAVAARHPDLAVLHFDAHADLREDYLGEPYSHATVMRRVAEHVAGPIYQFGIRSGTPEEAAYARGRTRLFPGRVLEPLMSVRPALEGRPLYVTVDIDVVDPAFAPGTGTPEAGGISSAELLAAIHALRGLRVVGFDLVEVCPPSDPAETTAILAAKVLRDALLCFC